MTTPLASVSRGRRFANLLGLAFLVVVAVLLVAEGFDQHVPKGYIYFAMAFSVAVEMLNIRTRKKLEPVKLRKKLDDE